MQEALLFRPWNAVRERAHGLPRRWTRRSAALGCRIATLPLPPGFAWVFCKINPVWIIISISSAAQRQNPAFAGSCVSARISCCLWTKSRPMQLWEKRWSFAETENWIGRPLLSMPFYGGLRNRRAHFPLSRARAARNTFPNGGAIRSGLRKSWSGRGDMPLRRLSFARTTKRRRYVSSSIACGWWKWIIWRTRISRIYL